jgi:FdhD protein
MTARNDPGHREVGADEAGADKAGMDAAAHTLVPVRRWCGSDTTETVHDIACEVAVVLTYSGRHHIVMMCSPADLEDLGLGFSLSEAIIRHPGEMLFIDSLQRSGELVVGMEIPEPALARLEERNRFLPIRSGCGLCGGDTLDDLLQNLPPLADTGHRVAPSALYRAFDALHSQQPLKQATGAAHAAAWCSRAGDILLVREDVGRHNALDKLLGAMWRAGMPRHDGFVCITSRVSFELVKKCLVAGVPALAAVSAPTALAVEMAQDGGLLLMGFARGSTLVAYAQADRLTSSG